MTPDHRRTPLAPPVRLPLTVCPPHACPYLPGCTSQSRAFLVDRMPPEMYHDFMDAGFRRSGNLVYQPFCPDCRKCVPLRIPAEQFVPTRSHRRVLRGNADLLITVGKPYPTDEKFMLYQRYLAEWHETPPERHEDPRQAFEEFLYTTPVETVEFTYRDPHDGRLLGAGLCDVSRRSLSTVYFYHDPDHHKRSLGTFSLLTEINFAQRAGIPWYYLGYWVENAPTMHYKSSFYPHELLEPDGSWRRVDRPTKPVA